MIDIRHWYRSFYIIGKTKHLQIMTLIELLRNTLRLAHTNVKVAKDSSISASIGIELFWYKS